MTYHSEVLTQKYLREALRLDRHGDFYWKVRPTRHFNSEVDCARANAQWAGKKAGRVSCWGYRQIGLGRKVYYAHRLVWLWHHGTWPPCHLDHINQDRLDNRIENLRLATESNNQANVRIRRNNTSGFRGVDRIKKTGRWRASICVRGIKACLGMFATPEEASAAYNEAHRIAFREFSPVKAGVCRTIPHHAENEASLISNDL